jgi:hypothetical protein
MCVINMEVIKSSPTRATNKNNVAGVTELSSMKGNKFFAEWASTDAKNPYLKNTIPKTAPVIAMDRKSKIKKFFELAKFNCGT